MDEWKPKTCSECDLKPCPRNCAMLFLEAQAEILRLRKLVKKKRRKRK